MSTNDLTIPDFPPEGLFGDLQEFQAFLITNPTLMFCPRRACSCPIAKFLFKKHNHMPKVGPYYIIFNYKTYPAPEWITSIVERVDMDCDDKHEPREYISATRVLELSKA